MQLFYLKSIIWLLSHINDTQLSIYPLQYFREKMHTLMRMKHVLWNNSLSMRITQCNCDTMVASANSSQFKVNWPMPVRFRPEKYERGYDWKIIIRLHVINQWYKHCIVIPYFLACICYSLECITFVYDLVIFPNYQHLLN